MQRRTHLGALAATALGTLCAPFAWAQSYPVKPIRLVIPFPPGGSTDAAGRVLSQAMAGPLGQAFVVDNKAGAAGALGIDNVAKSPADGYTLGVAGVGPMVTAELLGRKLPYSADKDLIPVGHMGALGLAIVAKPGLPARTLAELVALARKQPGQLSFGTSGIGSPGHLAFEYIKSLAGFFMVHIPYRGDSALASDLLGGQVDLGVLTIPGAITQAQGGLVRILAITSARRSAQLPQAPTVAESGVPALAQYEADIWNLLVAPAGTPTAVVDKLNASLNAALGDAAVRSQLASQGLVPVSMSSAQTAAFLKSERAKWAEVVKRSGAKLD